MACWEAVLPLAKSPSSVSQRALLTHQCPNVVKSSSMKWLLPCTGGVPAVGKTQLGCAAAACRPLVVVVMHVHAKQCHSCGKAPMLLTELILQSSGGVNAGYSLQ